MKNNIILDLQILKRFLPILDNFVVILKLHFINKKKTLKWITLQKWIIMLLWPISFNFFTNEINNWEFCSILKIIDCSQFSYTSRMDYVQQSVCIQKVHILIFVIIKYKIHLKKNRKKLSTKIWLKLSPRAAFEKVSRIPKHEIFNDNNRFTQNLIF